MVQTSICFSQNDDRLSYQAYLLDHINDALIACDNDLRLTAWNHAAETTYGWEAGEVLGKPVDEVLAYPDPAPHDIRQMYDQLLANGQFFGEMIHSRKDGTPVFIESRTIALKDADGNCNGFVSVNRNIAERILAQQAQAQLAAIVQSSDDAIFGNSTEGLITSWNKAAERMYGYSEAEILGLRSHVLAPPDRQEEVDRTLEKVNRGESIEHFETVRERKDGRKINVSLTISPIVEEGRVTGSAVIARDITLQKLAEQKLLKTAEDLARSNAELEQFAYIASHDLQEPLRMVTNYLQLIERRYKNRLDADADDFIAFAVDGAARMQHLINDLLSYSRVGRRESRFNPVDLNRVYTQVVSNLSVAIQEKKGEVTCDPLPTILGDELQLAQVFQNLIANGLKFHAQDAPRVHVSAFRKGDYWTLVVKDHGIGIDPEHHERIFGIFQRLHGVNEYPGTGIGLAICKKIIERHHGKIWVESQPNDGASFHFTLLAL
ncbi:MAG TPA: PAS domain S-box protein [Anaerolineaceae bacterium]|nr:PAS domain S-box protein [Anaerolineaceae bacterium]